jgi:hypothetical protein
VYFQVAKVAKVYFGIPVTSDLVERFFSKTGFILRPHRRLYERRFRGKCILCHRKYQFFN